MYTVTNCLEYLKELFFPSEPLYKELYFTKKAWAKLLCYINLIGNYEITGFGRVIENKVVDVKILKQKVKSALVDCDVEAMQDFLMHIPREETGQWTLDWHSHVDMSTTPSTTDWDNYKEQYEARLKHQFPFMIVNKSQQYTSKCYISEGRQTNIEIKIIQDETFTKDDLKNIYTECKSDIETLCEKETYKTTYKTISPTYKGSWYGQYDDYDYGYNDYGYSSSSSKKKTQTKV